MSLFVLAIRTAYGYGDAQLGGVLQRGHGCVGRAPIQVA
jgi:hypothetical protein